MTRLQRSRNSSISYLSCAGLTLALSARVLLGGQATPAWVTAMRTYPPVMPDSRAETYKTVGPTNLQLYIFNPKDNTPTTRRPAIVFFFGGGWTSGSPQQFEKECQYFASRGMVAITADYRVTSRQAVKAVQCVADAKSAIRWLRRNAERLGIDSNRIVASGGSSGGQLAACAAVVPGLDEPGEDTSLSATPNAAVLFNPVLVLAPLEGQTNANLGLRFTTGQLGVEPRELCPAHHVRPGEPPMIIFHGRADTTVRFATAEAFAAKMKAAGNRCELVGFDGQGHGFFNYGYGDNQFFIQTMRSTDEFLASLGYLSGPPQVEKFLKP